MAIPQLKIRNLDAIRNQNGQIQGNLHAEALDDVRRGAGVLGQSVGADPNGSDLTPPKPANLQVVNPGTGVLHIAITDDSNVLRSIQYYVEYDTQPGLPNPRQGYEGSGRNPILMGLPNGTYYLQVRAQYPHGGPASEPFIYSQPIVIANSVFGSFSLPGSQGAGTGGGGAGKSVQRQ